MNKVAIVAGSNGQEREYESQNNELVKILKSNGKDVVLSNCLYAKNDSKAIVIGKQIEMKSTF